MNKKSLNVITETNYKEKFLRKFIKNKNISDTKDTNKTPNYNNLKFKNKNILPKKEDILLTKSKTLFNINKIFFNIAQYNSKEKDYFINKCQLIDILKQGKIINPEIISINQTDIILSKIFPHKTKFNFEEFMNYLTELCHVLYKDKFEKFPKDTMDNFLTCLYNNYKDIIIEKNMTNFMETIEDNNCTLKSIETIISSKLERPIFKLILTLYENLVEIYRVYFPNELIKYKSINEGRLFSESSQNLFKFCKDFELYPSIINKVNLTMYYNLLMKYLKQKSYINMVIISFGENNKCKNLGICFKFSSFVLSLYHLCIFDYYKGLKFQTIGNCSTNESIQYDESLIDVDKIVFFFKQLENSTGIKQYLLERARTNEKKYNFIFSKKDINIAKKEMDLSYDDNNEEEKKYITTNTLNNNSVNKKPKLNKKTIESSPYTSAQLSERKIETERKEEKNNSLLLCNAKNIFNNNNFKKYFLNINKKENYLISLTDLDEILSVSPIVKEEIINKIEKLSEIFLRYSKIYSKLEYNRMSYSSFLKFLSDAKLLLKVPTKNKIKYRRISSNLMKKTYTVSGIKQFERDLKYSISCDNIALTKEEIKYKKYLSKLVDTSKSTKIKNKDKIKMTEASLIFSTITGSYNYPSYFNGIKKQLNIKDELYSKYMNDYIKKTDSFEPRKNASEEKYIPNKMNFALFIKSFELIASKLYPNILLDDAVSTFLTLKIDPFIISIKKLTYKNTEMQKAMDKMEKPEIEKVLGKLGNIIHPFFIQFADNNKQMLFYQFFDVYKNLGLFPEMISLTQMKNIFYTLCDNNIDDYSTLHKDKNMSDKINFDEFIISLGISSMLFNFSNIVSDTDRILYIYYFILESKFFKNINAKKNITKKIYKNLKYRNDNKLRQNSSVDNSKNRKMRLNYDYKTNKYICDKKIIKRYNFFDIYK